MFRWTCNESQCHDFQLHCILWCPEAYRICRENASNTIQILLRQPIVLHRIHRLKWTQRLVDAAKRPFGMTFASAIRAAIYQTNGLETVQVNVCLPKSWHGRNHSASMAIDTNWWNKKENPLTPIVTMTALVWTKNTSSPDSKLQNTQKIHYTKMSHRPKQSLNQLQFEIASYHSLNELGFHWMFVLTIETSAFDVPLCVSMCALTNR